MLWVQGSNKSGYLQGCSPAIGNLFTGYCDEVQGSEVSKCMRECESAFVVLSAAARRRSGRHWRHIRKRRAAVKACMRTEALKMAAEDQVPYEPQIRATAVAVAKFFCHAFEFLVVSSVSISSDSPCHGPCSAALAGGRHPCANIDRVKWAKAALEPGLDVVSFISSNGNQWEERCVTQRVALAQVWPARRKASLASTSQTPPPLPPPSSPPGHYCSTL